MNIIRTLIKNKSLKTYSIPFSTNISDIKKKRICIIGSGPAGFYAAQYLLKNLPECYVDVVDRLPVPFGLVRFGVAPDHPEVKNVINTFSKTAENKNFRFLGNLCLGQDFTLNDLRERYHAILLTYGANEDRKLNIPNENTTNVISAREFVAWYNGLPGAENLNPNLNCNTVTLIGQGNVAIDVARILLSSVDKLKTTDITEYSLETLSRSKIEKVYLIGRRGPLQAAFTIKELREMLKLPNVNTIWRLEDFCGIPEIVSNLQRPRKRLTELMLTSLQSQNNITQQKKQFLPIFLRSPKSINNNQIELIINELKDNSAIPTSKIETLTSDLILRSIGYKSISVDKDINFNENKGFVNNENGRVLKSQNNDKIYDNGLYVAGWLATGPQGVILTTMNGAFSVANCILQDFQQNKINIDESKSGLDIQGKSIVTWDRWQKIDKYEIEEGKKRGKAREKIIDINKMLDVAGV